MAEKRINCDDGVERSLEEALKWYREIAESTTAAPEFLGFWKCGLWWATVGIMKRQGYELPPFARITDVMSQTDGSTARGMVYRGYAYEHGIGGVEMDMGKAVEWYQKAAEAGDAYSMFALGNAYENGEGVGKDEEKALDWYRKAAATGMGWKVFRQE